MKTFLFQVYSRESADEPSMLQARYPAEFAQAVAERLIYVLSFVSPPDGDAAPRPRLGLTSLGRRRLIQRD